VLYSNCLYEAVGVSDLASFDESSWTADFMLGNRAAEPGISWKPRPHGAPVDVAVRRLPFIEGASNRRHQTLWPDRHKTLRIHYECVFSWNLALAVKEY
jgi:hypothetical protein